MNGIAGQVKSVKKLRSGVILVEVLREAQAQNLLRQTSFASVPVKVSAHRSMNTCKGVIRNYDLAQMDPSELASDLQNQGVTMVQNIWQTRNGNQRKTAAIILTFAMPSLPNEIKAGCYLIVKVDPYIPNPLRCFKCQTYGHHQSKCNRSALCSKCGLAFHGEEPCSAPIKCINCSGDHPSYATSCPKWVQEKAICRAKVTNGVSYPEARKLVVPNTSESGARPSYSSVASNKSTKTIGTQTDVVHCTCIAPEPPKLSLKTHCTIETQTEDLAPSLQEGEGSTAVGRSRDPSLSPRNKKGNETTLKKPRVSGPLGRQSGCSQNPPRSASHSASVADQAMEDGRTAGGGRSRLDQPRKKIEYPT